MLDCKKALEASNCDIEEAIKWLREKGIAKAEKKASRVAAEGLCNFAWYDYTKYQQLLQGKFEKNVLAPCSRLSLRESERPQAAGEGRRGGFHLRPDKAPSAREEDHRRRWREFTGGVLRTNDKAGRLRVLHLCGSRGFSAIQCRCRP